MQHLSPQLKKALKYAANGDAFFSKKLGEDYWKQIDPMKLEMSSRYSCVAARAVSSSYQNARLILGFSVNQEVLYGFVPDPFSGVEYSHLQRAWRMLLEAKKRNEESATSSNEIG